MDEIKRYSYGTLWSMVEDEEYPSDQATVVLTLHVSTEYWLDCILQYRCRLNEEELEVFDLSYSKKLSVLYKLKLLPDDIYQNLKALNELRNRFAHKLNYCLGENIADFNFKSADEDFGKHRRNSVAPFDKRPLGWWKAALIGIIKVTIRELEDYCIKNIGLPKPEEG